MQFEFRENHSTTLAIAHPHELIINNLDHKNSVCAIFLDLAKALDTSNHKMLLFKLNQYGIGWSENGIKKFFFEF